MSEKNKQFIDHSLYPDIDTPPLSLDTFEEKADYVERVCRGWDFDIFPEHETFELLSGWKEIFDNYQIPDSPAYHTFRSKFGWEKVEVKHNPNVHLTFAVLDAIEGREVDPWLDKI